VLDANGQALVYIYARETKAEASIAKVLTFDEARRVAVNVAKLPELLGAQRNEREEEEYLMRFGALFHTR